MQPWLVYDAIDFLNALPLAGSRIFEYGSGGSTLYWLNRGAECVSVEHNPDWYKRMQHRLKSTDKIDYRLVLPEPADHGEAHDVSDPKQYLSDDVLFRGYDFRRYVCQIDSFPDDFFDIVSIDGRARPACIMHSVTKAKTGGILILDNAERTYYFEKTKGCLDNYEKKGFFGAGPVMEHMWKTDIYLRMR
jgi:hypothetical protein